MLVRLWREEILLTVRNANWDNHEGNQHGDALPSPKWSVPASPAVGVFPNELKTSYYSNACIPMFITEQPIAKSWKRPVCPSIVE